jgi:hypothetical protein
MAHWVVYATNGALGQWIKEWRVVTGQLVAEFVDWNRATFIHTDSPERAPEPVTSEQDVFLLQLQDWVTAIRTNGQTRTPLREGAQSLDLVLAVQRSSDTHAEVRL